MKKYIAHTDFGISIDYENFQIFNNVSRNYTNGMIADLNDTEHFENLERIYHGGMFLV